MLTSGQLLADRYRLGRRIAVGGMGEVWEAADTRLDRRVAVKVLKAELCGDAEFLHRFRSEARMTASLNHPGIASVHDYGETAAVPDGPEDTAYLVMELVEGEPLATILAREGRLAAERTLDVLEQAGEALQAAHERGFVHRDVKPGNILVTPAGKVKLTDFGIAKAADAAPVTRSGMVMGTAHYIAPEQALGSEAEPASDVYSLAVVGYECLAGHRPFLSDNAVTVAMMHIRDVPPPLPPDVPHHARALVEATLVKDPWQRYRSGGEFASAVAAVRAGLPLPPPSGLSMSSAAVTPVTGVPLMAAPPQPPQPSPQHGLRQPPQQHGTPMGGQAMISLGPAPGGYPPPGMPLPPGGKPRRVGLWLLIILLVVVLIGLSVWLLGPSYPRMTLDSAAQGGHPSSTTHPTRDNRSRPGTLVWLDTTEFVGRPASEAVANLTRLGFDSVTRNESGNQPTDLSRCTVTEMVPSGQVRVGDRITLSCESEPGG
ncbi:serine/threonine-protein kinase [Allokutzneria albata]|uniref:non-specific serine/threonine protein kinase n=1 Tax=Allokutzneria albata TaxID=211114 RepID=A0A1G9ZZM4_ALLAB|nr:serine/threonine-protein kinase [Allokutzneria albata]SDN26547.1 serine/threonine protein kinase [Allokutzneria albata]